jgi:hypothetical protein
MRLRVAICESIQAFGRLFNCRRLVPGAFPQDADHQSSSRSEQIRADLERRCDSRCRDHELAAIDARMQGLPAELEAPKTRGKEEIAAEQARIKRRVDAEPARRRAGAARSQADLHGATCRSTPPRWPSMSRARASRPR